MRRRFPALIAALTTLAAVAGVSSGPAGAQPSSQVFSGYGSGATTSINVLQLGQTQALNIQTAAAGQSTFSQGLPASGLFNELGYIVQPANTVGNAFGRGVGAELGLLTPTPNPDPNQILLSGLATEVAPPNTVDPVVKQIGPISLGDVLGASLLRGTAQALWDPNICAVGKPFSFGMGEAADARVLGNAPATALVGTAPSVSPNGRTASWTKAATYVVPNGDGTFGVVSETRQTIAPVSLAGGLITVELLGEWALRAIATGKPGGARTEYAPVGGGPQTNALIITVANTAPITVTTQQLLGPGGLDLATFAGGALAFLQPILDLGIGSPQRALGGAPGTAPAVAADGTSASAASDVVRLGVLNLVGLTGANVRVGHMEVAAVAPPGGLRCNIPVDKTGTPDPVPAGQDFAITISIPSDQVTFAELFACDLLAIQVIDEHAIESGNPSFTLTGASNGGQINGNTVTWPNIGNYSIGSPPLQLTVTGRVAQNSQAGVLRDTANVTATLGNCDGTGAGEDIVGQGITSIGNGGLTGSFTLVGPSVSRSGVLAATGNDQRLLLVGGVLLLGAFGLRRKFRRPAGSAA